MTFSWYPRATTGRRDALARTGTGRETANKVFLIAERNMVGGSKAATTKGRHL